MKKLKIIFAALLVLGVSGAAGVFAAYEYMQVKAIVQERQDRKDAEIKAEIEAREAKEQAEKDRALQKQQAKDVKEGTAEEPDQVIRGLTANMLQTKMADGSTRYYYATPTENGIYLQPFILRTSQGATLYITCIHLGERPMNFSGVLIQTSKNKVYTITPESTVRVTQGGGQTMEVFIQMADLNAERALRLIAAQFSGKIMMANMPNGSNDDRMIQPEEAIDIRNMMDLYDIFNGKKTTDQVGVNQ